MLISETSLFSQKLDGKLTRGGNKSGEEEMERTSRKEQRVRRGEKEGQDKREEHVLREE